MSAETFYINTESERQACMRAIDNHGHYEVTIKSITPEKYRSGQQNNAIHKYCAMAAEALNDAGFDMNVVLSEAETPTPWTMETFKNTVWRKLQLAMGLPKSTTKLTRTQVSEVYDVVNRGVIAKRGISLPFPSTENREYESMINSGQV